eukprot:1327583-Rhodomonas_salina.5
MEQAKGTLTTNNIHNNYHCGAAFPFFSPAFSFFFFLFLVGFRGCHEGVSVVTWSQWRGWSRGCKDGHEGVRVVTRVVTRVVRGCGHEDDHEGGGWSQRVVTRGVQAWRCVTKGA